MRVAADLAERVLKYKPVQMPFSQQELSARERRMLAQLVAASRYMESIYWRQSDPEALKLYQQLAASTHSQDQQLRRFLFINASRYDLLREHEPFVGDEPVHPGRALYPADISREALERYAQEHPDKKQAIYDPYTVVRRRGDQLSGVPYRVAYKSYLESAARALRAAVNSLRGRA